MLKKCEFKIGLDLFPHYKYERLKFSVKVIDTFKKFDLTSRLVNKNEVEIGIDFYTFKTVIFFLN